MEDSSSSDSQNVPATYNNKFANDGSFLELFKKMQNKMKETSSGQCQGDDKSVPAKDSQVSLMLM